jgi:hypothetical protein
LKGESRFGLEREAPLGEYVLPAKVMKKKHFDMNNLISDVHTEDSASVTILKHPPSLF